ncbi:ferritin heavy chain-like [Lycaon pictus]
MTTVLDLEKNQVESGARGKRSPVTHPTALYLLSVGWGRLRQSRRGFLLQQCSDGRGDGPALVCPPGPPPGAGLATSTPTQRSRRLPAPPGRRARAGAPQPPPGLEAAARRRASVELYASCVSLSVSYRLDRDDVALKNFAEYFLHQSHEEREHAEKLMKLQNQRGGRTFLQDIKKPDRDDWENGLNSMECALHLEKSVNQSPLELHKLATDKNDPHLCDFIETHYLNEQVKSIKELGDHVTSLRKVGAPESGMAEYLFDKHALGNSDSES